MRISIKKGTRGCARGNTRYLFHSFPSYGSPVVESDWSPNLVRNYNKKSGRRNMREICETCMETLVLRCTAPKHFIQRSRLLSPKNVTPVLEPFFLVFWSCSPWFVLPRTVPLLLGRIKTSQRIRARSATGLQHNIQ